jgi:hypothetical protein
MDNKILFTSSNLHGDNGISYTNAANLRVPDHLWQFIPEQGKAPHRKIWSTSRV